MFPGLSAPFSSNNFSLENVLPVASHFFQVGIDKQTNEFLMRQRPSQYPRPLYIDPYAQFVRLFDGLHPSLVYAVATYVNVPHNAFQTGVVREQQAFLSHLNGFRRAGNAAEKGIPFHTYIRTVFSLNQLSDALHTVSGAIDAAAYARKA